MENDFNYEVDYEIEYEEEYEYEEEGETYIWDEAKERQKHFFKIFQQVISNNPSYHHCSLFGAFLKRNDTVINFNKLFKKDCYRGFSNIMNEYEKYYLDKFNHQPDFPQVYEIMRLQMKINTVKAYRCKEEYERRQKKIEWKKNIKDVHDELLFSPDLPFYKSGVSDVTKNFFNIIE